jgi:hypothetical protein
MGIFSVPDDAKTIEFDASAYSPESEMTITYSGNNPAKFFNAIPDLLKSSYRAGTSKYWDIKIAYDATSNGFTRICRIADGYDSYTSWSVLVRINGSQDFSTKEGSVTVVFEPELSASFAYGNRLQRWFYKMYYYNFYKSTFDKHVKRLRSFSDKFKQSLLELGGIEPPKN